MQRCKYVFIEAIKYKKGYILSPFFLPFNNYRFQVAIFLNSISIKNISARILAKTVLVEKSPPTNADFIENKFFTMFLQSICFSQTL